MPFYRFFIHGVDPDVPGEKRGFCVTRHAYAANQEAAAAKALERLATEFLAKDGATLWSNRPPRLAIEDASRAGLFEGLTARKTGFAFYDETE